MRSLREHPVVLRRNRRGGSAFMTAIMATAAATLWPGLKKLLQQEGIRDADGEIWLHTFPRVLGYAFKPVSFWYAHRADGSLAAIRPRSTTPLVSVMPHLLADLSSPDCEHVAHKCFHVSPFCETQGEYRRFKRSESTNLALVDLYDETGPLLRTGVEGTLHPLNTPQCARLSSARR
jgi:DUF1365 family protein